MSKYDPLWKYLKANNKAMIEMSFDVIKEILTFPIDHSFLNYKKEAKDYGYTVKRISLKQKEITFVKIY